MTESPPIPKKRKPQVCPKAQLRTERGCHILELLTVKQPRSTENIGEALRLSPAAIGSSLHHMARQCLLQRVTSTRGRGAPTGTPPNLWALRCWKGGAE